MKQQNTQRPFVDRVRSYNNGVWAVYLTGKDVLDAENRQDLLGVPFLAWNGSWTPIGPSVEDARRIVKVPYLSMDQLKRMEIQMVLEGEVPENVEVMGKDYPIGRLASCYVPFSFGIFHQDDEKGNKRIRSLSEYDNLVERVLPKVAQLRRDRAETKTRDSQFVNRALASVGLYRPASFTRYQPVASSQN